MKVCTDACILGAWFAEKVPQYSTILDIGSGTGLLMMMLAQKSKAFIHGIELDISCFKQLKENIAHNKWKDRLIVYPGDVRSYAFPDKFDFIITNPPFYENDLPSLTKEEKIAKHSRELSLKELLAVIDRDLSSDGAFGVLLPFDRLEYFNSLSEERHFYLREKLFVRHSAAHPFSRAILHYSRHKENYVRTFELNINMKEGAGYTEEFIELMRDYYLYL
ncbi:MAG TPA: methyltransferase [Flavitalea sp.]|nr:methyltransferase [Flavitalea sp.]